MPAGTLSEWEAADLTPSAFVDRAAIGRDGSGHVPVAVSAVPVAVSENCDRRLSLYHSQGITKRSKPVHPVFHTFFPKTHRPFHFDNFFERIYRFYIPLLERNGYNIHRQNEIHEYVAPHNHRSFQSLWGLTLVFQYGKRSSVPIREQPLPSLPTFSERSSLGGPLPRQQANQTHPHPSPINL